MAQVQDDDDGPIVGGNPLQTSSVQGRAWTLEGRLATTYDSNFRRTTPAVSAYRIRPLIHFGAGLPVGRQQLFFGADVGRDIFINQSRFNKGRYAVGGGVEWRLGTRCSGLVGGEALQRLTNVSEQDEFTDNVQKTSVLAATLGCRTPTGIGFGVSAQRRTASNDTLTRAPYDLRSTILSPNISYGTPAIGQFSISGTFNDTTYPNRIAPTPDGLVVEGNKLFQGRFGYQRAFGTRLQLALGASYLKSTPRPDAVLGLINNQVVLVPRESFSGSGYDGSITYQPSSRMTFNIAASRNVDVSPNVNARFIIRNGYGADFAYRIGPSLTFATGGRVSRNQYKSSFTTPQQNARISDTSRRVFASLDYSPVPLYSIGVDVTHKWRRADPVSFNYDSTVARLNLTVKLGRG